MIWVLIVGYFMHFKIIQGGFWDTDNDMYSKVSSQ